MPSRLFALLATIPARRGSCERLLQELAKQSRPPDGVLLCLDGYAHRDPAPPCALPCWVVRQKELSKGPGHRWRAAEHILQSQTLLQPQDLLVCIDDDAELAEAPRFLEALAVILETTTNCAAAAMGYTPDGRRAGPGPTSWGRLVLGCGCGLTVRAGDLEGLQELAVQVLAAGGPDALGPCGDDQALVSAHLWKREVPLLHAAVGPLRFDPGSAASSQWHARKARGEHNEWEQAQAIARITGWPLPKPVVEVQDQPALQWDEELLAVPLGAVRARGGVRAGWRRVLVVGEKEPAKNGVYDVPC